MGFIQKDALRITIFSYLGMFLGYVNKAFLFVILLSVEQIGLLNLILSVGLLMAQFCNLGSAYTIIKFLPFFRNKSKRDYGFFPYNVLIVTVGVVIFTLISFLFKPQISSYYATKSPQFVHYYFWFIPIGIAYVYYMLFENFLKAIYKNLIPVVVYEVGLRLLTTIALLVYAANWISFDILVKISSAIYIIPTLVLVAYLIYLKEFNLDFGTIRISKRFRRILFKFTAFSFVSTLGNIVVTTIDELMIAAYLGLGETGIYTTIVFITAFLQVPYRSLIRIVNPLIAEYWKARDMTKMGELYKQSSSVLLVISTTLFMYVWINCENLFYLLKPEFVTGINVFLFLMIGRLTDMYFGINGQIFTLSKKFAYDLIFTITLIFLVYGLNVLLIPKLGMNGAALGSMVAILVYNFGRALFVWFQFHLHPFTKSQLWVLLIFAANVILFEFIPHFDNRFLDIFVRSALFSLSYPLLLVVFKVEKEINNYVDKILVQLHLKR